MAISPTFTLKLGLPSPSHWAILTDTNFLTHLESEKAKQQDWEAKAKEAAAQKEKEAQAKERGPEASLPPLGPGRPHPPRLMPQDQPPGPRLILRLKRKEPLPRAVTLVPQWANA